MNIKDSYIHNGEAILKDILVNGSKLQKLKAGKDANDAYLTWVDVLDLSPFGASGHNHDDRYLKLGGGTLTGVLHLLGSQYSDSANTGALDLANSDIYGVNSIKFSDLSDGAGEGLQWYRDATHVDSFWVNNGVIYFSPNRTWGGSVTNYTVWHSGNDGSGSGLDADTVDGQHFSYSNDSNSPTYLWATNSNGSNFLAARGSISVKYADSAGYSQKLQIHDVRSEVRTPEFFDSYKITSWFNNTGTPNNDWYSGIHVKGWHDGYTSWELCSYSSTGIANDYDLYFRSGNNTIWGSWKTIITSGNIGSQSVNKATYASNIGTSGTAGTNYVTAANIISMYNWYNTITSTDPASNTAIDKWNEIVSFLAGITDTSTLSGILAGYAAAEHNHDGKYIKWGGSAADTTAMGWGTLTTANGYNILSHTSSSDGGDWGIVNKGGKIYMLLDGYYYQNEGRYRITDVSETVTALDTNGNYLTWTKNGSTNNITVPYAINAGNANTLDNIDSTGFLRQVVVPNNTENDFNTFSNMTLTGRTDPTTGASLKNAPWTGGGPAGGYGVLTYTFTQYGYGTQMAWGYGSNKIYVRNKHWGGASVGAVWLTTWDSLALTSDIPNVTDYYWANIKISASSNSATYPTFGNLAVVNDSSNSGYDALAYFRNHADYDWAVIISANNYGLDIRKNSGGSYSLRNAGNSRLIGSTIIGADASPSYTLDVRGSERIYSTYPQLRIENSAGGTNETSMYISNGTAGWAIGVNPWGIGGGVFGIGQYSGTGSSNWRFKIDNDGYCYTQSYLNLGAGNEKNASNPPYVWGVNGSDNYLRTYATSSLRVSYASSAGDADTIDGIEGAYIFRQIRSFGGASSDNTWIKIQKKGHYTSGTCLISVYQWGNVCSFIFSINNTYITSSTLALISKDSGSLASNFKLSYSSSEECFYFKIARDYRVNIFGSTNESGMLGDGELVTSIPKDLTECYNISINVADSVDWSGITNKPAFTTWSETSSTATYSLSNAAWTNTISLPNIAGSYILNITSGNSTLTGVFSIGVGETKDEISLHLNGNGPRLYARTNGTTLQLSSSDTNATSRSVTIKYRRMI